LGKGEYLKVDTRKAVFREPFYTFTDCVSRLVAKNKSWKSTLNAALPSCLILHLKLTSSYIKSSFMVIILC